MHRRGRKPGFNEITCPNRTCPQYGIKGQGNVTGNGTYDTKSGKVRKYICHTCGRVFCSRSNTAFYNLRTDEDKILIVLKLVLRGMSLRSISRIMGVKVDSINRWLSRAAEHSTEVNKVLLKDLDVSKLELDELWTFVNKKEYLEWRSLRTMGHGFG
jgi:transposase-like protein